MATITNSTIFTIASQSSATSQVIVAIIPNALSGEGNGRLIHPTLGTFDYAYKPEQWVNIDGSPIIRPSWQNSQTLNSGQNTLWGGNIKDVECREVWTAPGGLAMPMSMLRVLIAFFQNPPDPTVDYLQWWPSYITSNGYDVVMKRLEVGSSDITFTDISLSGWIDLPVTIVYQIVGDAT